MPAVAAVHDGRRTANDFGGHRSTLRKVAEGNGWYAASRRIGPERKLHVSSAWKAG